MAPRIFSLSALLLLPCTTLAQSNYRLAPIGGRSTLLGGTGIVYGRDGAAAFLNPATAVLADDNRLSFAVNFYTMNLLVAPSFYAPGPTDPNVFGGMNLHNTATTDFSFNALPSSLCLFMKIGAVPFLARRITDPNARAARFGMCFAMVQNETFNFAADGYSETSGSFVTRQAQTVSQSYSRFAVGPTYAMHLTEELAIGASLHGTLAAHRSLFAASATTYGATQSVDGAGKPISTLFYAGSRGDSFQFEPLIGATYRFGKQKIGASIKFPSIHVYGIGGANRQSNYDGSGTQTSIVTAEGSFVSRSPMRFSFGTGVEAKWGNAEFNTSFSPPSTGYRVELEGRDVTTKDGVLDDRAQRYALEERARGVFNASVGAEIFVSQKISALGGFATDFSALSSGALQGSLFNYYPSRTHRLMTSFGIASHGEGGELLVGGELSAGWGQRLAVNSYQLPPAVQTTGHATFQLMLVIAGSTSLKAIQRAVTDVKRVITEPRRDRPATPHNPEEPTGR